MKPKELVNCPLCDASITGNILDLNCGNFDNSTLYKSVKIRVCEECGHVYNRLSPDEIVGLMKYYNEEYAPANIGATDKTGDRPGSNNQNTIGRYDQLYNLISNYINSDFKILDIGCGMGGFLDYLYTQGQKNLSGIDVTVKYVDYAKKNGRYDIKLGNAELIPFDNNSFDLLIIEQVLEHLVEPIKAFQEAKRVLVEGGLFCIGVPDASRYDKTYFFDFYWFIMREHIQHFDLEHLKLLARMEGFELVSYCIAETSIVSEKMIMATLNVIFRLANTDGKMKITKECFRLKNEIENYVADELDRLKKKRAVIDRLVESQRPVYVWGIGREFLYLYEAAGLKYCNIVGLIDANEYKQNNFMLDGKKIMGRTILNKSVADSVLIITAIAHEDAIKAELCATGYKGEIFELSNFEEKRRC